MICPNCGTDNLPGNEECSSCHQSLTALDLPSADNNVERSLMEDPVHLLYKKSAITTPSTTPIRTVIQIMLANDIGSLLVVDDGGKLLGIFSERDLLKKVAGIHDPYMDLPVGDFMTPNPESVALDDTLDFALHKMDGGGYRHLPVVTDEHPAGVLSVRDLLRHITQLCKDL